MSSSKSRLVSVVYADQKAWGIRHKAPPCAWSLYIVLRFSARLRTIRGAGAFACQPVMFYRRKLPHWHPDIIEATCLFVTGRLADPSLSLIHISEPTRLGMISYAV